MTLTRYILYRIAIEFGYSRKNIRMADASYEMHLLREAEIHLGKAIWTNVEDIEELSMEYWSIRKIFKERDRVAGELEACQQKLAEAHEERAELLQTSNDHSQEIVDERRKVMTHLEELAHERDEIIARAREVRRNYDGIKMKLEVLEKEGEGQTDKVDKTMARINQLKKEFAELKNKRNEVGEKISSENQRIDELEAQIQKHKKERDANASEAFQHISDTNQKISNLSAELGVLDTQMRQLYSEIGRYVSREAAEHAACQKACGNRKGLVEVMAALRKSIQYNHKLADLSS